MLELLLRYLCLAKKQKVKIGKGDVVILHTGWLSLLQNKKKHALFMSGEPGLGVGLNTWPKKK